MTPEQTTAIGTLAGVFIGSILGFFGTWMSLRYQYRMKAIEMSAQSQLKAKELLFGAYQARIKSIRERTNEISEAFGKVLGVAELMKTEQEKRQLSAAFLSIFTESLVVQKEWFRELQEELKEVGLEQKAAEKMRLIEQALAIQPTQVASDTDAKYLILGWVKTVAIMDSLRQEVLTKRCENLFSSEIQSSISQAKR